MHVHSVSIDIHCHQVWDQTHCIKFQMKITNFGCKCTIDKFSEILSSSAVFQGVPISFLLPFLTLRHYPNCSKLISPTNHIWKCYEEMERSEEKKWNKAGKTMTQLLQSRQPQSMQMAIMKNIFVIESKNSLPNYLYDLPICFFRFSY